MRHLIIIPIVTGGHSSTSMAMQNRDHFLSGRIALLSDEKALEHVRNVKAWR